VHDDPIYSNTLKDTLRILKQFDTNAASTVFFSDKVNVFKSGFTRHVVQMRLNDKYYVPNQFTITPTCNTPQHTSVAHPFVRIVVGVKFKIFGDT
jgi:hypothetical protein